ncbi:selenocysteine lyase-like isoform X2 [Branchiostoma floridae x Branchiostoma belcheri]
MDLSRPRAKSQRTVYLDYNATTPLEPEVLTAIQTALQTAWGNPSSSYEAGKKAKAAIDTARTNIAKMVGGKKEDVIFTSGGTEANNMVILTAMKHFWSSFPEAQGGGDTENGPTQHRSVKPHIITTNIEHDSVRLPLEAFQKEGRIDVTFVPASKLTGRVEVQDVLAAVRPSTCLVTIMMANNETGIIMPVADIMRAVRSVNSENRSAPQPRILLHTDAAQTIGKVPVDVEELGVDYLTVVGHKFYGPRIGALYIRGLRQDTPLYPMLYGGGQEDNYRPGTENTGMIAGLGMAASLVNQNLEKYESHMREVRDYLEQQLKDRFGSSVHFNGRLTGSERIPNTCNVSILGQGLQGQRVLSRCPHLQASVGSACHSHNINRPSHILLTIGIPCEVAGNALRLSVGRHTTTDDIDLIIQDLQEAVTAITAEEQSTQNSY